MIRLFVNLKLKGDTFVFEHTSKFQNLVNQLGSIKLILGEEEQALLLLNSLPDNWKTLVVSLSNSTSDDKLFMTMVNDALFNEEARLKEMA